MLTFIGLWNFADDYGVVRANPTWLKNQIYPYKEALRLAVFSTWLARLVELEVIVPVSHRGESYYYIRTFRKHQKVDRPSKARNLPEEELVTQLHRLGFAFSSEGDLLKKTLDEPSMSTRENFSQEKEREVVTVREKETIGQKAFPPPARSENPVYEISLEKIYKDLPEKNKRTVYNFIHERKPGFIIPYVDMWNIFAQENSLAKITTINKPRKKHFAVRIQEPAFNFLEILAKAKGSEFLRTSSWFGFDWLIKNELNYVKVLEGNYVNTGNAAIKTTEDDARKRYLEERKKLEERTLRPPER